MIPIPPFPHPDPASRLFVVLVLGRSSLLVLLQSSAYSSQALLTELKCRRYASCSSLWRLNYYKSITVKVIKQEQTVYFYHCVSDLLSMAVRLGRKGWSSLPLCYSCRRFASSKEIGPENHPAQAQRIPEQGAWLPEFDVEVDTFQKTTVKVLNNDEDRYLLVNAYSNAGFRLNNGVVAIGPIALFPKTCIQWNVSGVKDLTAAAFSLFYLLDPKLDILVIGVGDHGNQLDFELIKELMKKRRLGLEILPTEKAVTTFNWLNTERRSVAGAFIPPRIIPFTENDLHETMERRIEAGKVDSVI